MKRANTSATSKFSDAQRRALKLLTRKPTGCAQALLLAHGIPGDILDTLVLERLATAQPSLIRVGGHAKVVVWVQITKSGTKAITE